MKKVLYMYTTRQVAKIGVKVVRHEETSSKVHNTALVQIRVSLGSESIRDPAQESSVGVKMFVLGTQLSAGGILINNNISLAR